jgi:hypothetical protein
MFFFPAIFHFKMYWARRFKSSFLDHCRRLGAWAHAGMHLS